MKRRKMWGVVVAAVAISVIVATLFGTGIMAKGADPEHGISLSIEALPVHGHIPGPNTCVPSTQYSPGDQIVWRIHVSDASGPLTDSEVPYVFVNIHGVQIPGDHLVAVYGNHGGLGSFWTVAWTIPTDYAITGTLAYQIIATDKKGNVGKFSDFTSILILQP